MKTLDTFGKVLSFLLENKGARATTSYDAKRCLSYGYVDALKCLGYDKAHARGYGCDYDKLVLRLPGK